MAIKWTEAPEKKKGKSNGAGEAVTPAELDDVERALAAPAAVAGKLHEGMGRAVTAVERLFQCGLTQEALCILIAEKCPRAANGTRVVPATVRAVLEGLAHLDEYKVGP